MIEQVQLEFEQPIDEHTPSIIRNLLQALLGKLYRIRSNELATEFNHKYMHQFLQFQSLVELECTTHRDVAYYANKLNITSRTLNSITHAILNKSPKTFINEVLSLQIKRKLINTDLTIKEIAYQSGFNEPTNLFKFFRKFTKQTPELFRSIHATAG